MADVSTYDFLKALINFNYSFKKGNIDQQQLNSKKNHLLAILDKEGLVGDYNSLLMDCEKALVDNLIFKQDHFIIRKLILKNHHNLAQEIKPQTEDADLQKPKNNNIAMDIGSSIDSLRSQLKNLDDDYQRQKKLLLEQIQAHDKHSLKDNDTIKNPQTNSINSLSDFESVTQNIRKTKQADQMVVNMNSKNSQNQKMPNKKSTYNIIFLAIFLYAFSFALVSITKFTGDALKLSQFIFFNTSSIEHIPIIKAFFNTYDRQYLIILPFYLLSVLASFQLFISSLRDKKKTLVIALLLLFSLIVLPMLLYQYRVSLASIIDILIASTVILSFVFVLILKRI